MLMMSDACDGLRSTALIPRALKETQILQPIAVCICLNSIYATISSVVHLELKLLHNLVVDRAVHQGSEHSNWGWNFSPTRVQVPDLREDASHILLDSAYKLTIPFDGNNYRLCDRSLPTY